MTCCLTARSHYLNQCFNIGLVPSGELWGVMWLFWSEKTDRYIKGFCGLMPFVLEKRRCVIDLYIMASNHDIIIVQSISQKVLSLNCFGQLYQHFEFSTTNKFSGVLWHCGGSTHKPLPWQVSHDISVTCDLLITISHEQNIKILNVIKILFCAILCMPSCGWWTNHQLTFTKGIWKRSSLTHLLISNTPAYR